MSAAPELRRTVADLERLTAGGYRYELVEGALREMSPVGGRQGRATNRLGTFASAHALRHALGEGFAAESGVILALEPDTVLAPDWAFIRAERLPRPLPRGFLDVVPDLVLETRSPNERPREIREKIELWLRAGVQVVWDLDPERRVLAVHRPGRPEETLGPEDTLVEEALLPGFSLALREVF